MQTKNLKIPELEQQNPFDVVDDVNAALEVIDKNALSVMHKQSKAHFDMWQPQHAYYKGDIVRADGIPSWGVLRCKTAGTSNADVLNLSTASLGDLIKDGTDLVWALTTICGGTGNGISNWEPQHDYSDKDLVIYDANIYQCTQSHTATDKFNESYWRIIGDQKSTAINKDNALPWKPHTHYSTNQCDGPNLCIYKDTLYICIKNNVSGDNFITDEKNGYWKAVDNSQTVVGSDGGYSQITKMGVQNGSIVQIPIQKTTTFCKPPIEVLKFKTGSKAQIVTANNYNNGDSDDFLIGNRPAGECPYVKFDGTMHPAISYNIVVSSPEPCGKGYMAESDVIDFNDYKKVVSI